ncbi:MAG TPA: DUF3352 domain-containing protein [Solirubrobacteraceae bacterium]|nr:DUF3352 domain-containing protein [Solirubrobacteraceae bacterium]
MKVRRTRAQSIAVLVAVLLAVVLLVRALAGGDGSDEPPSNRAAEIVPDTTLVFANLSTDGDRDAVQRAADMAERFEGYDSNRAALLKRLSGGEKDVDPGKDVAPWLGDEAAFALMDTGNETAGSLVAIEVTDEEKAREFLARNPREAVRKDYKEHTTIRYGQVTTSFVRGFLVIGQDPTVQAAIDREKSGAKALAGDATYKRALEGLPEGRVVTAYASADGLRRLLVPAGDVLGGLAVMLDQPALQGVAVAAEVQGDDKLRVKIHSALDAEQQKRSPGVLKQFEPGLVGDVPADALGYLGASGVSGALQRLVVSAVGGAAQGGEVTELLRRLGTELGEETGGGLQRDLLKLFEGEVALVIQREAPAPVLSILTRTADESATRRTLDRLREPLAKLLRPEGEQELTWEPQDIGGADAWTLTLPNGAKITYAVTGGRLIISTSPDGVRGLKDSDDSLQDADVFEDVLADRPGSVGTLGFLDFSQLLELGEQTGLNDSRAYLAARDDLRKVRAIGVSSTSDEGESTAEILVSIP